jgi:esterase
MTTQASTSCAPCHYQILTHSAQAQWVILIHGLFGNLDNLKGLGKALQSDFNVMLVDLPDHGKSSHTDTFSLTTYAQRIAQTIRSHGISSCHLVGHSLGGKAAMMMALDAPPDLVFTSLVVADIAPVTYPARHDAVFAALNGIDLKHVNTRAEVQAHFARTLNDEGTRQFLLKGLRKTDGEPMWQWQFNLPLLERDYHSIIAWPDTDRTFSGPTLFIKGALSDYITTEMQPAITQHFPNAKARVIAGTGHWLHAQKPQIFNAAVSRFLQANP